MLNTKPLVVVFCLPGDNFSSAFLTSWTLLISSLPQYNIISRINPAVNSNVYYVRSQCLGADVLRGIHQKPFNGQYYDYTMWIDSDIIFSPDDFFKLLEHKKDIVSGIYMMKDTVHYATVEKCDRDYFVKNGSYKFMTNDDIKGMSGLLEVDYTGFGFMLIKKGIFESFKYPWFRPIDQILTSEIQDFSSEDVSFCFRAREAGFKIHVDPTIRVGHEKKIII